jgi:hypothetical protein
MFFWINSCQDCSCNLLDLTGLLACEPGSMSLWACEPRSLGAWEPRNIINLKLILNLWPRFRVVKELCNIYANSKVMLWHKCCTSQSAYFQKNALPIEEAPIYVQVFLWMICLGWHNHRIMFFVIKLINPTILNEF